MIAVNSRSHAERFAVVDTLRPGDRESRDILKTQIVLIVEDEPLIRMDAASAVEAAGFTVLDVSNADEAIAVLETRSDVAIIFTDIQMPGSMDGLKLAAAVRDRWPPIRIVATSGNVRVTADDLPRGGRFLRKPYGSRELADLLHTLADAA